MSTLDQALDRLAAASVLSRAEGGAVGLLVELDDYRKALRALMVLPFKRPGERLRIWRAARPEGPLTLNGAAEVLGVDPGTVFRWESGLSAPDDGSKARSVDRRALVEAVTGIPKAAWG